MRRRDYLGSFELMVLLTVMHLGEDAYGVPITEELETETGHEVAVASVYAAFQSHREPTRHPISSGAGAWLA